MVRDTSVEAYNAIRQDGLLSRRRMEVYCALYEHGPCTANELFKKLVHSNQINQQNITTRLGELRDRGCARELGTRRCSVTGMTVIVWDVTSKLPVDPKEYVQEEIDCPHCKGKGKIKVTTMFERPKRRVKNEVQC